MERENSDTFRRLSVFAGKFVAFALNQRGGKLEMVRRGTDALERENASDTLQPMSKQIG